MDIRDQLQSTLGSAYTIERELGGGGMSRVFVAEELRLKRQVVIKLLSPELAQGISIERFDREIQTAASLQQANIVPVLTAGESNGLPYYIMPLVKGESLRTRLARGPMPISDTIGILRDTARALAYAHEQGVVHRDIKPDNILLSGETAVVTDFGIAKAISASRTQAAGATLTQVGTALGTPAYMAPEQIAGDPNVDQRSDLYALGCVAFELLTGHPPFDNRTPQRVLAAHLTEPPRSAQELRPDCPPALAELVTQLLAKDPNARPGSAALVAQALNAVTTSGASPAMSAALIGAPPSFLKATLGYLATFIIAVIVARAAVIAIGLPEWIVPSMVVLMIVALPVMLGTLYVQHVARQQLIATPVLTPGGTATARSTMSTLAIKASPHVSWRRTQRLAGLAAGAFVALVAAFMALRALGIGPAGSLFAAGHLHEQDKLLVTDFTVAREDSALAPILSEAVRSALGQSRVVQLLSPADVAAALTQMRRSRDDRVTDAIAQEVAARAGAQAVVSGRVARVGTGYAVSIALTSASGGSPLASYQATADGTKDLLSAVDELAKKLRAKMGESLRQVERARPLAEATTSSLEALRKYSEGAQANDVDLDFDRAITALRQAVALDTTFALAYRKLAVALGNGGYGTAARDSALERAARYADKLPDREKGLVMGAYYYDNSRQGDLPKAIAAYEAAYAADSMSLAAANQLATLYCARSDFARCLRYARRMSVLQPTVVGVNRYAQALATSGDSADARKLLDSLERVNPDASKMATVWLTRAEVYYADGKLDSLRALIDANLNSDNENSRDAAQRMVGAMAMLRGRPHEGEHLIFTTEKLLAAKGNNVPPVKDSLMVAFLETVFEGNAAGGLRALDGALAAHPIASMPMVTRPYLDAATAYARGGQIDKARAMLARYDAEADASLRRQSVGLWHETHGEIALAEGRYPEALTEFRQSNTLADGSPGSCDACVDFDLARTFDKTAQPDSAIAAFERYLAVPAGQRFFDVDLGDLAATEKRLGELYDAKGDLTRAASHYTSFVQLWQDAEPELQPAVTSVKQRLAAIAAHEHH